MGRACIWASEVLAAVALFAGASRALATEEISAELSPTLQTLVISPGFDLVRTSDRPPELVDYTIASLMRLATPWPIKSMSLETPTVATAEPSASVAPAPIDKTKTKTSRRPKMTQKPQQKSSWVTADWWRGLFWVRIR
jgi:hypothetical protein